MCTSNNVNIVFQTKPNKNTTIVTRNDIMVLEQNTRQWFQMYIFKMNVIHTIYFIQLRYSVQNLL